jgi:hypothetical protein
MVLIGLEARVPILKNNQNGSSDIGGKNSTSAFLPKFIFGPFSIENTCIIFLII